MATSRDHTALLVLCKLKGNQIPCLSHSINLALISLHTCLNTTPLQVSVPSNHLPHRLNKKNLNHTQVMRLHAPTVNPCTLTSTKNYEIAKICTTDLHRVILLHSHHMSITWADLVLLRSRLQDLTSSDRS